MKVNHSAGTAEPSPAALLIVAAVFGLLTFLLWVGKGAMSAGFSQL